MLSWQFPKPMKKGPLVFTAIGCLTYPSTKPSKREGKSNPDAKRQPDVSVTTGQSLDINTPFCCFETNKKILPYSCVIQIYVFITAVPSFSICLSSLYFTGVGKQGKPCWLTKRSVFLRIGPWRAIRAFKGAAGFLTRNLLLRHLVFSF